MPGLPKRGSFEFFVLLVLLSPSAGSGRYVDRKVTEILGVVLSFARRHLSVSVCLAHYAGETAQKN